MRRIGWTDEVEVTLTGIGGAGPPDTRQVQGPVTMPQSRDVKILGHSLRVVSGAAGGVNWSIQAKTGQRDADERYCLRAPAAAAATAAVSLYTIPIPFVSQDSPRTPIAYGVFDNDAGAVTVVWGLRLLVEWDE